MRSPSSVATSDSPQSMTAGDQGDLQITTGSGSLNLPALAFQSSVSGPSARPAPAESTAPSTGSPPSLAGSPGDITGGPTNVGQSNLRSNLDILPELDNDSFLQTTVGFMSKMKDRLSGIVAASAVETFLSSPKPEETSPGPVSSLSSPRPPSLVNEALGSAGGDLSYRSSLLNGSAGGEDSYTCELRKQREFIPECKKDDKYWERRRKNNEAAKRSREKRRQNDMLMEREIAELKDRNEALLRENAALKLRLGMSVAPASSAATAMVVNQKTERPIAARRPHVGGDAGAGGNSRSFSDESDGQEAMPREDRNQKQETGDRDQGRWHKLDEQEPSNKYTPPPQRHHAPSSEETASGRPPLLSPSDTGAAVSLNALDLITLQRLLSVLASGGGCGVTRWDQMLNAEKSQHPPSASPSPDATTSAAVASLLLRQARKPLQSLVMKNTLLESLQWQQSGLLDAGRSVTGKLHEADQMSSPDLPESPLDLRLPLRNMYAPQAGDPIRQRLPADKLSELAVITSDDALSSTPHGPSTQRSSISFSVSPPSQRQVNHHQQQQRQQQNSFISEAQMAAVAATLTPSPLLNPALQPLLSAPGLQETNQLSSATAAAAAAAAAQLLFQQKDDVGLNVGSLPSGGLIFPLGGGQTLAEATMLSKNSLTQQQFAVGQGSPANADKANTSGSSSRSAQRRRGGTGGSRSPSRLMDERYRERRRRNNEAVRRCRENKRARINMRDEVTDKLQNENQSLRNELSGLSSEVQALRQLLSSTTTAAVAAAAAATANGVTSPTAAAATTENPATRAGEKDLTSTGPEVVVTEREGRVTATTTTTTTTNEALSSQTEELWTPPACASLETAKYAWPKKGLPRLHCRRRLTAPPYHESLPNTEDLQPPSSPLPPQTPPQSTAPTPPAALTEMMREAPILQH
nr:unnamed protein product [Spirometra erinaceieuropaei]